VSEVLILIEGELVGRVRADKAGRLSLAYEDSWRESAQGHALSVNLPLAQITYPHKAVLSYLWNLLPENPNVLQRWGQQYRVSAANPFKLLAHVGADVPGAAQFLSPQRLEDFQSTQGAHAPMIQWLTIDELAERLRDLRADAAAVRRPGDIGKMSLPGAQAKTAFYWDEQADRWGVPGGREPTTHIIKPCIPGFDGLVENEHLCQDIAARLGMPAANSRVLTLDQTYIVVERYDRLPPLPGSPFVQRIHQEDICQALGLMPGKKYQEDGGPGIAQIVTLIRRRSSDPDVDVDRFLKANMFNWLIGATDGHAKNYSLLIAAGDEIRLAPLYDLSSQLPYPALIQQRVSMKIGDHYDIGRVGIADWRKLARACAIEEEYVVTLLAAMIDSLPGEIAAAREQAVIDGLSETVIAPLADQLLKHVGQRRATIRSTVSSKSRPDGKARWRG
jgi:serine/threonine-protein kinase HipA